MNRREILTATFGTILSGLNTPAHSTTDGPSGRFEDDLISNLEGNWRAGRKVQDTVVEKIMRGTWVFNHQFLQLDLKYVEASVIFEAIILIGYIHSDTQYVAHWIDNFGGKFSGVARGFRKENTVEFRFDYSSGSFFYTLIWIPELRFWISKLDGQNAAGLRAPFVTDLYVRQG